MATIKAKVIGGLPVCGVENGDYVDLDPEKYLIQALVDGGHIEVIDKPIDVTPFGTDKHEFITGAQPADPETSA